jgi:hypothetical protein
MPAAGVPDAIRRCALAISASMMALKASKGWAPVTWIPLMNELGVP